MSDAAIHILHIALALLLAPLLPGIIHRVKAKFGGRTGRPYLQLYYDLVRLLRKSEVISTSTTWIFQAAPALYLATVLWAIALLPLAGVPSFLAFQGDFLLAAYLLAMGRFALNLAALDTASPFEGMGASREAAFSALAEPVLFVCFLCLARSALLPNADHALTLSLSGMFAGAPLWMWSAGRPELLLLPVVLFIVLLVENCRIPVDDPNTHLELTMIHEVIILDHSGPSLACILYAAALKLWFFAALLAGVLLPVLDIPTPGGWGAALHLGLSLLALGVIIVLVGVVESVMARLRMDRIIPLLGGAGALACVTLALTLMR